MTITEGMGLPNECFDALLKDMREIYDAHSTISDVLDTFESFLSKLTSHVDVDVMPGHLDFSSSFLP
jgi:DNA polymerase II small subunit/DNA polymerase delta subunit B